MAKKTTEEFLFAAAQRALPHDDGAFECLSRSLSKLNRRNLRD